MIVHNDEAGAERKRELEASHSSLRAIVPNPINMLSTIMEKTLDLVALPAHHHSSTVQRVLQQDDSDSMTLDIEALKQKYAREIKADAEVQSLSKQIRNLKQQLQYQRLHRERTEKKHEAQRDREQKHLDQQVVKLQQALEATTTKKDVVYNKALLRARSKRSGSSSNGKESGSIYNKLYQAPQRLTSSSSTATMGPAEKEALRWETKILRTMHRALALDKQVELATHYAKLVESGLKRERALLDNQQAETAMFQMVLEGTQRALIDVYPEVVLRQEAVMERLWHFKKTTEGRVMKKVTLPKTSSIPRLILPSSAVMRSGATRQSFRSIRSDGVSSLGESLIATSETDSADGSVYHRQRCYGSAPPPVFTSVQTLQQHTLQHMAGVASY